MRASYGIFVLPIAAGCHLASGIDDIRFDTRTNNPQEVKFACEPSRDNFVELDATQWTVTDDAEGITVAHDPAIEGVVVNVDDASGGARGGLITADKYNLNDCAIFVEVDPPSEIAAFAAMAVFGDPSDATPLLSLRKEGSDLTAAHQGNRVASIGFNADQRFWRIKHEGEQILFEHSLDGRGNWQRVGAVAKPDAVKAVHIGLVVGTSASVTTDSAVFYSYEMEP